MELTSFVNFAAEKFEARFEKVCSYLNRASEQSMLMSRN
jgi:hypothetical protein